MPLLLLLDSTMYKVFTDRNLHKMSFRVRLCFLCGYYIKMHSIPQTLNLMLL